MNFGCSQCLCIAIESHRSALLKSLLERPNVVYRDMFWARQPIWRWCNNDKTDYPILHDITDDSDLSFVGRDNCGHTPEDEELLLPLTDDTSERVLVSLPLLAKCHSTKGFDAEQMLRDSGKFDFSDVQLAHTRTQVSITKFGHHIFCATSGKRSILIILLVSNQRALAARKASEDPLCSLLFSGTHLTGLCFLNPDVFLLELHLGQMEISSIFSNIFSNGLSAINEFGVCREVDLIQRQIDNGADLNCYMAVQCAMNSNKKSFALQSSLTSRFNGLLYYGLMPYICMCCCFMSKSRHYNDYFDSFRLLLSTLLRNGFSLFLGRKREDNYDFPLLHNGRYLVTGDLRSSGLVAQLIVGFGVKHLEFSRSICRQLLALGYGRRELHPQGVLLYDENLDDTRKILEYERQVGFHSDSDTESDDTDEPISSTESYESITTTETDESIIALELQSLVTAFDAGPLSLLQLSRIAVRRAFGGVHFVNRIKALSLLLPPLLYDYVADPTELLHTDFETPAKRLKLCKQNFVLLS